MSIIGISFQTPEWQQDFVTRNTLRFPLLSDVNRSLAHAMSLQTFRAGDDDYLVRRTLIVENGFITHDVFPIAEPAQNAQTVLDILDP